MSPSGPPATSFSRSFDNYADAPTWIDLPQVEPDFWKPEEAEIETKPRRRIGLSVNEYLEEIGESLKARLRRTYGIQRLQIIAYPGYRCEEHAFIRGRVICGRDIEKGHGDHGAWRNFCNMAKRFLSVEIPHAQLEVDWDGQRRLITTDHAGFFSEELPMPADSNAKIQVRVLDPDVGRPVEVEAPIVPSTFNPNLVVVSDIDDTVILTWAWKFWRMIRVTLFGNATTRKPFAGVAEWYRALQRGPQGDQNDPVFYVSSSPWNIYDFIQEFLNYNGIPTGPIFLRTLSSNGDRPIMDHHTHKLNAIERLLNDYPTQDFLLIGDSGQKDPEIYRDLVLKHPGRIRGVCIRNVGVVRDHKVRKSMGKSKVNLPIREAQVERIGQQIKGAGT
ncbi:MAG: phosphatase domain-containing protein, partial [Verrucomicrobiota bacterium]